MRSVLAGQVHLHVQMYGCVRAINLMEPIVGSWFGSFIDMRPDFLGWTEPYMSYGHVTLPPLGPPSWPSAVFRGPLRPMTSVPAPFVSLKNLVCRVSMKKKRVATLRRVKVEDQLEDASSDSLTPALAGELFRGTNQPQAVRNDLNAMQPPDPCVVCAACRIVSDMWVHCPLGRIDANSLAEIGASRCTKVQQALDMDQVAASRSNHFEPLMASYHEPNHTGLFTGMATGNYPAGRLTTGSDCGVLSDAMGARKTTTVEGVTAVANEMGNCTEVDV